MHKPMKRKKEKVAKITEAEYIEYISHLRDGGENEEKLSPPRVTLENTIKEK